jgi:hypothetical protein
MSWRFTDACDSRRKSRRCYRGTPARPGGFPRACSRPQRALAVKLRQIAPTGIILNGTLKSLGAAMKVSLKPFHRVCLASAVDFVVVLIVGGTLSAPPQAATNATVQQSQCMRRVTVTSKPCGATIYIDGIEVGRTPMSFRGGCDPLGLPAGGR